MPAATSDEGYPDCREFMNKAIKADKGWRARFAERGKAVNFRMRCYTARTRERKFNLKFYSKEDVAHGKTVWDELVFFLEEVGSDWEIIALQDAEAMLDSQLIWQGPVE